MSNLTNKIISIANVITRAGQGLSLAEKRILFSGLAQLGGKNDFVDLRAEDFSDVFGVTTSVAYRQLKEATNVMFNRYITYQAVDGKNIGLGRTRWISSYEYFDDLGYVRFKFNQDIFPYLFELENKFTKYRLQQACSLRSIHSWRLLELFEQYRQSYKTGKTNEKGENVSAKNKSGWLKMPIEEFNNAMETPESYRKNFKDLRVRIIEPAIKELKEKDHWVIDWKTIKKGRKVFMLEFIFTRDPQQNLFD